VAWNLPLQRVLRASRPQEVSVMAETSMYVSWRDIPRDDPARNPRVFMDRVSGWIHKLRSDADLLRLAQTGDTLAFAELVIRFRDRMYTLALSSLRDPSDAADVVCEVFLTAYRRLGWFDRSCSAATWFYMIALTAVLKRLRSSWGDFKLQWSRGA